MNISQKSNEGEKTQKAYFPPLIPKLFELKPEKSEIKNAKRHEKPVIVEGFRLRQGNERKDELFDCIGQIKNRADQHQENIILPVFDITDKDYHPDDDKIADEMMDFLEGDGHFYFLEFRKAS